MGGTNWGYKKLRCQQWMHADPPLLFPYNEDAVKVQTTTDFNKEDKQSAALCMNLYKTTWKGTESEERVGQQHWGMLGRAPCLLPLECPGAAYISPAKPAAAPSATHSQSATTPDFPWNSATDSILYPLFCTVERSCEIMDSSNWDLLQTIITAYTVWGFEAGPKDMSHKYPVGLDQHVL